MVGTDGRPTQKSLRQMLGEWIGFRLATVERRSRHRLGKVAERIHILEGRQLVLLNIDEVIAHHPRRRRAEGGADRALRPQRAPGRGHPRDPAAPAGAAGGDQDRAGAEGRCAPRRRSCDDILASPAALKRTVDRARSRPTPRRFGDERRTLIEAGKRAVAEVRIVDEPVTVVVSLKGWVRALKGHEVDPAQLAFKAGDALYGTFACRSVDTLLVFGSNGRVYSVAGRRRCRAAAATASRSRR